MSFDGAYAPMSPVLGRIYLPMSLVSRAMLVFVEDGHIAGAFESSVDIHYVARLDGVHGRRLAREERKEDLCNDRAENTAMNGEIDVVVNDAQHL